MTFTFQVLSDVHLKKMENNKNLEKMDDNFDVLNKIPHHSDNLIIAGDLFEDSDDMKFVEQCLKILCVKFKRVFFILGNHEFYSYKKDKNTHDLILSEFLEVLSCKFANLHILHNEYVDIEDVRIYGSTLWSNIPFGSVPYPYPIYFNNNGNIQTIDITWLNEQFYHNLRLLQNNIKLAKENNKKLIVVTHHAPTKVGALSEKHLKSPYHYYYATNLNYLMGENVACWVFGHTHVNIDEQINRYSTRIVSNQFAGANYDENKTITIS